MPRGKPFVKGNPGKQKGTQNKYTKTVKETVLTVFNELQGDPKNNLLAFAQKYPRDFYPIAAKLIPAEVSARVESDNIIRFIREDDRHQAQDASPGTTDDIT